MSTIAARARTRSHHHSIYGHGPLHRVGAVLVWIFTIFCICALVFVLVSSFKTSRSIINSPWSLPDSLHFENWAKAWEQGGLATGFVNSVILLVTSSVVTVAIAAPAAYILSRRATRAMGAITVYFVVGLGIPLQVMVLPLYSVMSKLGLINSLVGLFILYVVVNLPFTIFLLTGFFGSLPSELEDAAAIDGLTPNQTFWRIMLPLAKGGLLTGVILAAISVWNETFLAMMFIQSNNKDTLPLALLNYYTQQQFTGSDYGALMAAVSIAILPMIILFIWLGRRLTQGLTVGATK